MKIVQALGLKLAQTPLGYTTIYYWRTFLYLAQQFTCCTTHGVPRLVVLLIVPLLMAPVWGCVAVVCLCCTRTAVRQTDAAEPGLIFYVSFRK